MKGEPPKRREATDFLEWTANIFPLQIFFHKHFFPSLHCLLEHGFCMLLFCSDRIFAAFVLRPVHQYPYSKESSSFKETYDQVTVYSSIQKVKLLAWSRRLIQRDGLNTVRILFGTWAISLRELVERDRLFMMRSRSPLRITWSSSFYLVTHQNSSFVCEGKRQRCRWRDLNGQEMETCLRFLAHETKYDWDKLNMEIAFHDFF